MKQLLFVYNPVAGKAMIANRLHTIIDYYMSRGFIVTVIQSGMKEELREYLHANSESLDQIVCCGGDGTLNNMVSLLMRLGITKRLGYLPMGSTNDFAKTLGYSLDYLVDLKKSCFGQRKAIDVGKFNDSYFIYIAAFGSLTEVAYSTSQQSKNVLGHLAYVFDGIKKITDLKAYHMRLEMEDAVLEDEFCLGLIMNSLSIGGFKNPVSKDVVLDDGLFEVLLVRMPHNLNEVQQIAMSFLGQKIENDMLIYRQCNHVKITSDEMNWTLDGEYGGCTEIAEIWNLEQALEISV